MAAPQTTLFSFTADDLRELGCSKPEEVARYRVESDAKPQAGKQLVRLPAGLRLDHSSFQQGIRWNGKVTQMADLIHRYVLSLPVGRKKGSYIVWDEVIKQIPPYRVDASSLGRAKVKGSSKLKIEGEVLFAKSPRANPNYEIKAGMQFKAKAGMVASIEGGLQFKAKGGLMAEMKGGMLAKVKGAFVMIN